MKLDNLNENLFKAITNLQSENENITNTLNIETLTKKGKLNERTVIKNKMASIESIETK